MNNVGVVVCLQQEEVLWIKWVSGLSSISGVSLGYAFLLFITLLTFREAKRFKTVSNYLCIKLQFFGTLLLNYLVYLNLNVIKNHVVGKRVKENSV